MGWLTQPHFEKGLVEGKAEALTRFLEKRFGALSTPIRQRISAADAASVNEWIERAFDDQDLQSIFTPN